MRYYLDSQPIGEKMAATLVGQYAMENGWDIREAQAYWARRHRDEEAREVLTDMSQGHLEFIAR